MGIIDYTAKAISELVSKYRVIRKGTISSESLVTPKHTTAVDVDRALNISTVYACVRLITGTVGMLPIFIYERRPDGSRVQVTDHDLYHILHDQPNALQTAPEWKESLAFDLSMRGNHYSAILRSGKSITSVFPLNPNYMVPEISRSTSTLVYKYKTETADLLYKPEDIFHVKLFGPNPVVGLSPISCARASLSSAVAIEDFGNKFFTSGAKSTGYFSMDGVLNPAQRKEIRTWIKEQTEGDTSWTNILLEAGMKYNQVSLSPEDSQMLQSKEHSAIEICGMFQVPPVMIGLDSTKQFSIGELHILSFLKFALQPTLTKVESRINNTLFSLADRSKYYAEFNLDALLRTDSKTRAEFLSMMGQNGYMTRNEGRAKENLPPVEGGDDLTVQSNLIPLQNLKYIASQNGTQISNV